MLSSPLRSQRPAWLRDFPIGSARPRVEQSLFWNDWRRHDGTYVNNCTISLSCPLRGSKTHWSVLEGSRRIQGRGPKKLLLHSASLPRGCTGWRVSAVAEAVRIACPHVSAVCNRLSPRHEDDHRCRMPNLSLKPARSSPICLPRLTPFFMLCCAGRPRRPGAKRSIRKRIYRVMKVHGLLLQHGERRRNGVTMAKRRRPATPLVLRRVAFITCDKGEKVRVAIRQARQALRSTAAAARR